MDPIVLGLVAAIALAIVAFFVFGRKKPAPGADNAALQAGAEKLPAKAAPVVAPIPQPVAPPRSAEPRAEAAKLPAKLPGAAPAEYAAALQAAPVSAPPPAAISVQPAREVVRESLAPRSGGTLAGLKTGLSATRKGFMARLADLLTGRKELDPALLAQLEEVLLTSDVGPKTTEVLLSRLRERLGRQELKDEGAVWSALRAEASAMLSRGNHANQGGLRATHSPTVVLMVGVNGVGKTTTIGKLATKLVAEKQTLLLGAGDTFRAAAVAQLEVWGKRIGVEVARGKDGADPASVAFEATTRAKADGVQFLLMDTAGRLHTKAPLMDEIKKVRKSIGKALDGAPHETLLVLDATTGQNALNQAALFKEAVDLTGIVLTKLDGTAKGGIVLAIAEELNVPVRYIGLGEKAEDLREFNPDDFVEALFARGDEVA